MKLIINGDESQINVNEVNVTELLVLQEVESPEMVSVQLNGEFILKEDFETQKVEDGDEVDFLYFMGGGC